MSYTTPTENPQKQSSSGRDNRKTFYGILIAALVLTWGYIIYDKSKTKEIITQKDTQITTALTAKDSLQVLFNDASAKADSLTGSNVKLHALAEKNNEILKLKSNIRSILNKKNATEEELKQAKAMIAELNAKIDSLFAEIQQLTGENQQLTAANQQLTTEKTQLTNQNTELQSNLTKTQTEKANIEDIASILHASNIQVKAVIVKKSGKEVSTNNAKRADMFVITCNIDENRITPSGKKTLYVCVTNPDGTPSGTEGTFKLRDGSDKAYSNAVEVNYEQGKTLPVSFNWKPGSKFTGGNYKIEIYNNGFKIGEAQKTLNKGGFLGL
jgi:predicted  nucleic acid-binding Zn-ribbon protein